NIEHLAEFQIRKNKIMLEYEDYIQTHPEVKQYMQDFLQMLVHQKPEDVFEFTRQYFKP
ncbi:hypothetical protein EDD86DRAFT_188935, partial [Gorgonomyces haynaldii]